MRDRGYCRRTMEMLKDWIVPVLFVSLVAGIAMHIMNGRKMKAEAKAKDAPKEQLNTVLKLLETAPRVKLLHDCTELAGAELGMARGQLVGEYDDGALYVHKRGWRDALREAGTDSDAP